MALTLVSTDLDLYEDDSSPVQREREEDDARPTHADAQSDELLLMVTLVVNRAIKITGAMAEGAENVRECYGDNATTTLVPVAYHLGESWQIYAEDLKDFASRHLALSNVRETSDLHALLAHDWPQLLLQTRNLLLAMNDGLMPQELQSKAGVARRLLHMVLGGSSNSSSSSDSAGGKALRRGAINKSKRKARLSLVGACENKRAIRVVEKGVDVFYANLNRCYTSICA